VRADYLEKALANTLLDYQDAEGAQFFKNKNYIGIVEPGLRDKVTEATAGTEGFHLTELPAVRVWCDSAPAMMERNTTNEDDIERTLMVDVIVHHTDRSTLISDAEEIRDYAAQILRKQTTMADGQELQRDLFANNLFALGSNKGVIRNVEEMPYKARKLNKHFWYVVMSLQVTVFYIERH